MKKIVALLASIVILASPLTVVGQDVSTKAQKTQLKALAISLAPIKSEADLKNYLALTPKKASALRFLSDTDRQIFINSLTFNENGLTSINTGIIRASLSKKQQADVLALFGAQHLARKNVNFATDRVTHPGNPGYTGDYYPSDSPDGGEGADREGERCIERGTCFKASPSYTCMSSC